jgi:uncharacterized protein
MKSKISKLCKDLEKEKGIKILFAIENGSRAWRMDSKDSDYDVRFVYKRDIEDYIQIKQPRDVVEAAYDKEGNRCKQEGSEIDLVGFDVFKYLKLLLSSNPTCIEWLTSDIVYHGKQNKVFKEFANNHFNPIALYHHYKSMCKMNYIKYIKSGNAVTYKKYLYAYRGLINAKWVAHKKTVPPIIFPDAIQKMQDIVPDSIINKLNEIIKLKSSGQEKDIIQNIVKMDNYIESFLKDDKEAPEKIRVDEKALEVINKELRKLVIQNN